MLKKMWRIITQYYLFFIAMLASLAALGLEIGGRHTIAHWTLGVMVSGALIPLLVGMVRDIREGKYGVDILAATAIVTAVIMQEYWAAAVVVLMLTGGAALEDYAGHRAESELEALIKRAPQKAHVVRHHKTLDVRASEVQVHDVIVIRPGEMVPVDARITEGIASFDESSLTGESLPQAKQAGDTILSGAINLDGAITATVLRTAANSQYQQIIALVRGAQHHQAPFVRLADRYAVPFTILAFVIAITAWVISGESLRFLEVLVVATPCPLILAAPIAIISGMSRSAKHGIIIKTGAALEQLAEARTFAFDKTGTLTKGQLSFQGIATFHGFTQAEVLAAAASVEQHSNHAQAQAITARANQKNLTLPKTKNVREIAGKGVVAQVQGRQVIVGRLLLLTEHNVVLPAAFTSSTHERQTAAFVSIDGQLAGCITFRDELRDDAKATLKQLRKLGIKNFMMVTGDNATTAKAIAKTAGITQVHAQALPGDKLLALESVTERPVAFVGDGVNDAPVLTASDVGIALGARGAAAAAESADIVVMLDELSKVGQATAIAKRTFAIARQSILVGIGLSVALMLIFSTGKFKPVYGAAIQELVDVVVIFNALRAHGRGSSAKN